MNRKEFGRKLRNKIISERKSIKAQEHRVYQNGLFAGRRLTFQFASPHFVEKEKRFIKSLENTRKQGTGAVVIYIDMKDDYYKLEREENDMGFLYALLGETNGFDRQNLIDFEELMMTVIPLSSFAHEIGMAIKPPERSQHYQLVQPFSNVVRVLKKAFNGNVFLADRNDWELLYGAWPREDRASIIIPHDYEKKVLQNTPQITEQNLFVLEYLGKPIDEILDNDPPRILVEYITQFEKVLHKRGDFLNEKDILAIMSTVPGTRVFKDKNERKNMPNRRETTKMQQLRLF